MSEGGITAQPGVAPAARRTAGTMFAALHGTWVPHDWSDPEADAYSLFHHRSLAMGWLDDRSAAGDFGDRMLRAPGLWGMNDAGWGHPLGTDDTNLVSWFQVEASAVADDRPLPVQPFLRCAVDATALAGALTLSALQVLLPVQGLFDSQRPAYAPVPATRTGPWFAGRAPRSRTSVAIGLNSGQDPAIPAIADNLADYLGSAGQDVFTYRSHDFAVPDTMPGPPFGDHLWNGPPGNGVVVYGDLVEWSCDAAGWVAEILADAAARLGAATPLLLTIAPESRQ
ncbi:hypothetical protein [Kibdelosporangium phytohabitans]|uniref:Uncharacterized protein n=1 Tax=Kibdelosporangium phytohabitans TaxID=860235 RepID=A0A0N9HXQ9_9PSEU|nr:hypothetical protein [Kibdelosporangium phytohabitans]ALG08304.1 hypothetical protein AOZ06_16540 [Kibdelosporangium phytohabitans]MBE1470670.1 hypothetical protein [Kibdelosporangium phytohabitans]